MWATGPEVFRSLRSAQIYVSLLSFPMNIHEYQAKELLQKFDVATTRGRVAATLDDAEQIARELGDIDIVVRHRSMPADAARAVSRTDLRAACTLQNA